MLKFLSPLDWRKGLGREGTEVLGGRCRLELFEPEARMSEKVGETVRDSADYRCERCHQTYRMSRGALIQPCPNCGYDTFDIANPRFERRDGSLGPHEPG